MALVKTIRQHQNTYGDSFVKKKGVEYDHPAPGPAINAGFIKLVKPVEDKAPSGSSKKD